MEIQEESVLKKLVIVIRGKTMNKTRWEEYREKNGSTPIDILNPLTKKVDSSISDYRYEICKTCPELVKISNQCKKCGCFMSLKTKIESSKCPLGKW